MYTVRIHDILWPIIILRPTIILLFLYITYPCLNRPVIRQPIRDGVYSETNLYQYHICTLSFGTEMARVPEINKHPLCIHSQYLNCWWPVDAKNPGISSHSGLSTRRVNGCFTQYAGMFVQSLASWYAHGVLQTWYMRPWKWGQFGSPPPVDRSPPPPRIMHTAVSLRRKWQILHRWNACKL